MLDYSLISKSLCMKKVTSIITALLISLSIYLFYRSEKTVVNELFVLILSFDTYMLIKSNVAYFIPLKEIIIFSLPGGLWVFCTTALSLDFYLKIGNHRIEISFIPLLFAIGLEFCQLVHITNGTFDFWDIVFYLTFWLLAYYSPQPFRPKQNILSPFTLDGFICMACFISVYLAHVRH
jgi:hypothetical protein